MKQKFITLAVVVAISSGGAVKYHAQIKHEQKLQELAATQSIIALQEQQKQKAIKIHECNGWRSQDEWYKRFMEQGNNRFFIVQNPDTPCSGLLKDN
jgi:hypothetical protein